MKKFFKGYIFKKVFPAVLILLSVLIGIIKVDLINTKSLSPLGNTNENYKMVSEEFGEDFSNFIKDNSAVKIYKEDGSDILVRLGEKDFKITNRSIFVDKIQVIFKNITQEIKGAKDTIVNLF